MSTYNDLYIYLSIYEILLRRIWSYGDSLNLMNRQWWEAGKVKEGEQRIEKNRAQQGPRSRVSTLQMTNRGLISKVTDDEAHS